MDRVDPTIIDRNSEISRESRSVKQEIFENKQNIIDLLEALQNVFNTT